MTKDRWLQSALTNEVLVADLLLRLKHSSDSYSLRTPANKPVTVAAILPPRWGNRKTRSKSAAVANGFVKDKEHRRSPTTHLSWSGGAGSSSDGYEDCSRPSDLSSASRSVKANEGASISSYNNLEQKQRNKLRKIELCSVNAETEGPRRGFVLPDLNMTPNEEDMSVMVMI
ncbi:hypothetical protein HanRHA438_Chr02g0086501 [Helianthus annuus]|uniref:Uncharacterized protein n=1 Tax=Helianthus annuus TaxID=4232 RepID=A0A251VGY1_HELAN|nr:uncharacterized protein LOC110923266 [Helianthus annuus]KAF5819209.1 hypothetical protein HanXRQr2_Chr02g0075091 [Helianthus annuus]KAJ0605393.1 hypothetical protein HanHA300_Chr02g0062571 [Helianthus annuus]KAJ0619414.1 hypothetical protein HanHA89_Chr02g0071131 [Helianthus annuus]KAJ0940712.1 hypothetical protein HanRHA438_Chr02g0086501 [Helianthus annuus]